MNIGIVGTRSRDSLKDFVETAKVFLAHYKEGDCICRGDKVVWQQWIWQRMSCEKSFTDEAGVVPYKVWASVQPETWRWI